MNKNTYWNSTGKYQEFVDGLNHLVPAEGVVKNSRKNRALEKFRKASNCYYDLYNNGLDNRLGEVNRVMGIAPTKYRYSVDKFAKNGRYLHQQHYFTEEFYDIIESKMDEIIIAAAIEQVIGGI